MAIRTVQVGDRVQDLWVIDSGLNVGDRVVSEGTSKVRDGAPVNPQPESARPAA